MNSGVGDAVDLAWKLEATLNGFGGPNLLASYQFERRQVGDRNVGASRYASLGRRKWRSMWRPNIRDDTAEGRQTREILITIADVEQRKSNEMIGAELGYRYVSSPIICDIPGGPEHLFRTYEPTTWPGARLPHIWLDDGGAMQDRIPTAGYTILRLGRTTRDSSGLAGALKSYGTPVHELEVPDQVAREVYGFESHPAAAGHAYRMARQRRAPDDAAEIARIATGTLTRARTRSTIPLLRGSDHATACSRGCAPLCR